MKHNQVFIIKWNQPNYPEQVKAFTKLRDITSFVNENNGFEKDATDIAIDIWYGLRGFDLIKKYVFTGLFSGVSFHLVEVE